MVKIENTFFSVEYYKTVDNNPRSFRKKIKGGLNTVKSSN